jgi:SAM-dependent methyltransferase
VTSFEDWDAPDASADIVAAAQSWHWLNPEHAFPKAERLLRRPGAIAIFANTPSPNHTALRDAIDAIYRRHVPRLPDNSVMTRWSGGYDNVAYWRGAFEAIALDRPEIRFYEWTREYSTEQYLSLLRTHSDHRALPTAELEVLLDGIATEIERHGSRYPFEYRTVLVLARRTR